MSKSLPSFIHRLCIRRGIEYLTLQEHSNVLSSAHYMWQIENNRQPISKSQRIHEAYLSLGTKIGGKYFKRTEGAKTYDTVIWEVL